MRYSAFNRQPRRQEELIDDGTFQCCQRIGRSYLICGKKSSHFPYTCFVGPDWYCMLVTYALIIVPTVLFIHNVAVLFGAKIIVPTVFLLFTTLGFFSYTACSDPGIAFAPKAAYNSSDEDNNAGISLVDAVHHHVSNLGTTSGGEVGGDGEREKFHIPAGGRNHSSGSSNGDHLNETHNNGFVAPAGEEEGMQGDIEDGLNHINSQHTASVGPQTALIDVPPSSGSSSGMSNRITISGGNRIRIGAAGSGGGSMLNHSTSVGNAGAGTSGSSGGGLGGLSLQPRLPPPPLIECGRCQIDRPRDASHCSDCGVCVRKLDHHCPWTGKCIGAKTIYSFFAFLASLGMLMCFVICVVVVALARNHDILNFNN